jgi:hypothetical protein
VDEAEERRLECDSEDEISEVGDLYHMNISVDLANRDLTEADVTEVDQEFIDALVEIEGQKEFPCTKCGKHRSLSSYNSFNCGKLLEDFYGLIPRSWELLNCGDFKVANLIMIHIPDHLVGFSNISQMRDKGESSSGAEQPVKINPAELGPLSYVGGYVVSQQKESLAHKMRNFKHYCRI